jgi:hypothetical protein
MAAVTDLASAAAAVSAGYAKTQVDKGASAPNTAQNPRFLTRFEKPLTGAASTDRGFLCQVEGESTVDAATADTNAVAKLNTWRRHYYGGSPGRASGASDSPSGKGGGHTVDTT